MVAAKNNHKTTVKRLLSLGADPLAVDKGGWTALHHAAGRGQDDCVRVLLAVSDVKATTIAGSTPLHWAVWAGYLETVKLLTNEDVTVLDTEDEDGNTPLDEATMHGQHAVEAWLAKKSGAVHMDAARCLRLMRIRRGWDETCHSDIVSWMAE
ncbi:ankyrin repeat and SOCS box protein 7-like, partial [Eriocheir sinensis]|uniref:ankyrin repeat and SOCS box protein 7-like n=1 Tax=Eriocheir sinensis TaxID=95602 RepID=UPI0021CA4AC9